MANISAKQQKVLDFLRQYTKENGYSPSVRDICEGLGFSSTSTVHGYLCRLEERGLIRRYSFRPRTIEIVDDANILRETVSLPVIGGCSRPAHLCGGKHRGCLSPSLLVCPAQEGDAFILNVVGESMVGAGILMATKS